MDPKVLSFLATAFSALLAAVGYYAKTKHERRRATRAALYYLLELHHLLGKVQLGVKKFPLEYAEKCRTALHNRGLSFTHTEEEFLAAALEQLMRKLAVSELDDLANEIVEPFTKVLGDLAKEDPLLAFQLKGRESIAKSAKLIRTLMVDYTTTSPSAEPRIAEMVTADLDDFSREISLGQLRSSIRSVAWRCDFLTLIKCHFLLRRGIRNESLPTVDATADDLINEILKRTVGPQNTQSS